MDGVLMGLIEITLPIIILLYLLNFISIAQTRAVPRTPGRALNPEPTWHVARVGITGTEKTDMRGVLLWLIGIPIPIIILLYLFNVI